MADLRSLLLAKLGKFPARVAPEEKFDVKIVQADGTTRTRVTYSVEAGERISAWLLQPASASSSPANTAPRPAVLALHQHNAEWYVGKSEPAGLNAHTMYHYGAELCRMGFIVLCPDHLCFEERRPPEWVRVENNHMDGAGYERFEATKRILEGSCLQAKYLHDLTCAVDVLARVEGVDATRLGVFGHSLGGQEALWLMALDDRVRAGVSSCGFTTVRSILRAGINHNQALYVPGLLEVCDMDAIVASLAPRPFCFTAGVRDPIFPIDGVREIEERARTAYAAAGAEDALLAMLFDGEHGLPDEIKSWAYGFLARWLALPMAAPKAEAEGAGAPAESS